jgi:glycerophosphoryl diester phosphodiesterase
MTEGNCQTAHENGKMFSAWTLDSEEEIKSAIDMGVDTYFTNDTPLALSLEREYGLEERGESSN